jgi:cation/acetate symporter
MIGIVCFAVTVLVTLMITGWAGRQGQKKAQLYNAGGSITGPQNGLAISGDFMSATTVLGITGLFFSGGWDTIIFYLAPIAGLALMLLLVARPLRRLGVYTLGDVLTHRLKSPGLRLFSGLTTVVISLFYLLAQMVGAGTLIAALFHMPFLAAVCIVGALMAIYVAVGGMLAATWVQIVKAGLLVCAVTALAAICLVKSNGLAHLYAEIAPVQARLLQPGGMKLDPLSAVSLGLGMVVGLVGLPHLLIRFFTVPDEHAAQTSVVVSSAVVGWVNILLFLIIGPSVLAFVAGASSGSGHVGADGKLIGGSNMAILHLAQVLGGDGLNGIISAVAFSTILAVVAGLTIASASAAAHDVWRTLRAKKSSDTEELWVFRLSAVLFAGIAIALAVVFQHQNIAFLSALAFAVAASTNFPVLILVLYWRGLTTAGALIGGLTGLLLSVGLIVVGPQVWVAVLHHAKPIFPYEYPALFVVPVTFITCYLISKLTAKTEH